MNSRDTNHEIKHLEYIQRHRQLSPAARRRVVGELTQTVATHNRLVEAENNTELRRGLQNKNEVLAREAFTKHGKHRIYA